MQLQNFCLLFFCNFSFHFQLSLHFRASMLCIQLDNITFIQFNKQPKLFHVFAPPPSLTPNIPN